MVNGGSGMIDWDVSKQKAPNALEYAAGFQARLAEIARPELPHPSWTSGWEDADTEMLESARHRQMLEQGRDDCYYGSQWLLFDAGQNARENKVPFDPDRTEPWKQGWIATDIKIGHEVSF